MDGSSHADDGEEPDDAGSTGLPSQKTGVRSRKLPTTAADLGLDIESARKGKIIFLLPIGKRDPDSAADYPLPTNLEDLLAVSLISFPPKQRNAAVAYIRRARTAYKKRMMARNPRKLDDASDRANHVLEGMKKTRDLAKEELEKARQDTIRAAATLSDLYGLIRAGHKMIMEGFVKGEEVNGERVDAGTFVNASGKVLGHIAKLGGISDDDKSEAESAVFEQAAEATRKRLKDNEELAKRADGDEVAH